MSRRPRLLSLAIALLVALALPSCKGCRKKPPAPGAKGLPRPTRTPLPPTLPRVVVLTSGHSLEEWLKTPPAKRPVGLVKAGPGERVTFNLLITEYRPPDLRAAQLRGQIRVTAPDGRVVLDRPDAGRGSMATMKAPRVVVLVPSSDIVFTNDDQPGVYAIGAMIEDLATKERHYFSGSFELVFRK